MATITRYGRCLISDMNSDKEAFEIDVQCKGSLIQPPGLFYHFSTLRRIMESLQVESER